MSEQISRGQAELVLEKLGISRVPNVDINGLREVYAAWCRKVPFDNLRKLIHVTAGDTGPLPGDTPEDFFSNWMKHKTGGTCWAGNGALQALLSVIGFDTVRGIATMMVADGLPPNHGTVIVRFESTEYLADASILHSEPLHLKPGTETSVSSRVWGVRAFQRDSKWVIAWRPLMRPEGLDCRIEFYPAKDGNFSKRHDLTRAWSPFNYELNVRLIRGGTADGIAFGQRRSILSGGEFVQNDMDANERRRCLIEDFGYSEEIVSKLPADRETPPPPGSHAAMQGTHS